MVGVSLGYGGELIGDLLVFDLVDLVVKIVGFVDISLIFNFFYWVLDVVLEAIVVGIC